ncbi:MAG: iron uptake porin [Cyanobacteria bacterium]|nr:iron uptake porin [Cyanobacteriota bacterium]
MSLSAIQSYSSTEAADQVTSVSQFSDVRPTDWAFQALSNLIERHGCVAGYPDATYRGGKPLSRYEAAALLNACLDRITEVTDELKRLVKEFENELALLRGRVDGLEVRVGELEANKFSTTTKLRADTRWVLGALNFTGNQKNNNNTYGRPPVTSATNPPVPLRNALTFNYDVRLNFDTSFTGKDLLRTQLRAGNFRDSGFGSDPARLTQLEAGFEENIGNADGGDVVAINRLFYKFPVGKSFTAIIGPRFASDEGLPFGYPSVYKADQILRVFQHAGSPAAYNRLLGSGAGLWWRPSKTGFALGGTYVSGNADNGQPNGEGNTTNSYTLGSSGGIGNEASQQTGIVQLGYQGKNWNLTGAYAFNSAGVPVLGTPFSQALLPSIYNKATGGGHLSSWSVAGWWQPLQTGWLPSLSAGWGYNTYSYTGKVANTGLGPTLDLDSAASQSWYVGLNWKDAFIKGNALGFAIGQPTFITSVSGPSASGNVADGQFALEGFYKFQVTNNIAVTPAIFWLSRPRGVLTNSAASVKSALLDSGISNGDGFGTFGGLVQTTFKF